MGGFLPPVVFTITANATQAMATFKGVNTQLKIMDAQAKKTSASMMMLNKSMLVATAAAKAFAVVLVGFAAYGVKEIMSLEQAYARLGQTMSAVGVSTEANRQRLADVAQGMENLGFDAATASDALSILLQTTKSVETSEKLLATAADLARARQMDLATAARLLSRAQAGNTRIFSMFGIQLDKNKDKATATKEAMEKLTQVIGGQAEAYTKTFAGQLAVLGKQIENIAEGIGAALLPYLMKFLSAIQRLAKFLNEHREILAGVAFVIGTVMVAALVNMTKKLYAAIAAWAVLNAGLIGIIAALVAVGAGIIYLWNKFEGFRKGVIGIGKLLLEFAETVVMAFSLALNVILLLIRGTANAQIALGKLMGDEEMVKRGKKVLDWIDATNKKVEDFGKSIQSAQGNLDKFKNTKIDLSKFKLPSLKIGDFGNQGVTPSDPTGLAEDIRKSLAKAAQYIKDFNADVKDQFKELGAMWKNIVGRDINKAVQDILTNPVDELILKAQDAVNAYQEASNKYTAATQNLTKAQIAYQVAVASGKEETIMAAESAMKKAEDVTKGILDGMRDSLADIKQLQQDMIRAIADSYRQIGELEIERTKVLAEAQKERAELEKQYNVDVAKIRQQYDKDVLAAQEAAAKRSAEIVKQSVDQLRSAFKSATYRTVGDIFSALTFEGRYMKGGTTEKILEALGLQTKKAETLAADAATLAGLGFSQTFIEEVVAQGPDVGHQLAQTIINSSPESIAQMKAYWEALQRVSTHGVDDLAKRLNSGIILATEELTAELANVQIELAKELKGYEQTLTESLTEAFETYSKALDDINVRTAQQIAAIALQIAQLQEKIRQLQSALSSLATLQAPGVVSSAPNLIPTTNTKTEVRPVGIGTCPSGKGNFSVTYNDKGVELSATFTGCVIAATVTPTPTPTPTPTGTLTAGSAYTAITGASTLTAINAAVNNAVQNSNLNASGIANAMASALLKSPDIADIGGVAGALSSARYTGQAIAQMDRGVTVNITANTNASAQEIANDVGWAIRTSGDVQYRTIGRGKMVIPE